MEDPIRIELVEGYDPTAYKEAEEKLGDSFEFVESRGSSGEVAAWITLSGITIHNLPHILDFLKFLITRKDVRKLIYSEKGKKIEIYHPTQDVVDALIDKIKKK